MGQIEHCPGCELIEQEREHMKDQEERGVRGLSARLVPRDLAREPDDEG